MIRAGVILLLAICAAGQDDVMSEMMAERAAKAAVAKKLQSQPQVKPQVQLPVLVQEVEKSEMLLDTAKDEAQDAIQAAKKKATDAEALAAKASSIDASIESQMNADFEEKKKRMEWEISFLQNEQEQAALRRDASFLNKEIKKLEGDKEESLQEIRKKALLANKQKAELQSKASALQMEADVELDRAEKQLAGVEAVAQQYEDQKATPAWMVHAQLKEYQTTMTAQEEAELKERNAKKRALWQAGGKELTCSDDAPQVHAFIMDSKKDESSRAQCLERQLSKYCFRSQRAPATSAIQASQKIGVKNDCLPNGIDARVPEEQKAMTGARWCSMVQLLEAVSAQSTKYPYFLVLDDDVKIDAQNFEEMVRSFAKNYKSDPWSLVQIDAFGKHSERDEDMLGSFKGLPVFRNTRQGEYLGFHSVLIKTAHAPQILSKMMSMSAVPLDSLPTILNEEACEEGGCKMTMPTAAALQAFITESPKAVPFASALVERETMPHVCEVSEEEATSFKDLEKQTWAALVQVLSHAQPKKPAVPMKTESKKARNKLALGFGSMPRRESKVSNQNLV